MPTRVETADPEGVDYGWVMQVTFVVTILVGSPVVALASTVATLPTWGARAAFAVRVGAVVWLVTAVAVYAYARRREPASADGPDRGEGASAGDPDRGEGASAEGPGGAGGGDPTADPAAESARGAGSGSSAGSGSGAGAGAGSGSGSNPDE